MPPVPEETVVSEGGEAPPRYSEWRRFIRVLVSRKVALFGVIVLILLIGIAIFADLGWMGLPGVGVAPYDPYKQDLARALEQPSAEHWLGTDPLGRDELSRIIYGSRVSLMVGIIAVGIAAGSGIALGLISGFFGGWLDAVIMRIVDAVMAIPPIALALAIAAALGGGLQNIMIAVGISLTPGFSRIMRGLVLSLKETDYVMAGRSIGASNPRIMLRYILPNAFPILIVVITVLMGAAILIEAGLSFLGIGIAPPGAAWGNMVSDGYRYLLTHPILSFAPGLCIMLVVLSFNLAGDGLRDALDPRLRGVI